MPFSPFTKLLAATGIILGGGKLWSDYKAKKRRKKKKKPAIPADYLSGYYAIGATLGAAEDVVADIEKPVSFAAVGMRDKDGNVVLVRNATIYPPDQQSPEGRLEADIPIPQDFYGMGPVIGRVVTNLTGDATLSIYDAILNAYIDQGADSPQAVADSVLQQVLPLIRWSSVQPDSAPGLVRSGATTLAEIARQNLPGA